MAKYDDLKTAIKQAIKQNSNQEITGNLLQSTLLSMVDSLGENKEFLGFASPSTNPGTPKGEVFYFASGANEYVNFPVNGENENVVTPDGLNIIYNNASTRFWNWASLIEIAQELGDATDKVVSQKAIENTFNSLPAARIVEFISVSELKTGKPDINTVDGYINFGTGIHLIVKNSLITILKTQYPNLYTDDELRIYFKPNDDRAGLRTSSVICIYINLETMEFDTVGINNVYNEKYLKNKNIYFLGVALMSYTSDGTYVSNSFRNLAWHLGAYTVNGKDVWAIADKSVTTDKLADKSVTTDKLVNSIASTINDISPGEIVESYLYTDNYIYVNNNIGWSAANFSNKHHTSGIVKKIRIKTNTRVSVVFKNKIYVTVVSLDENNVIKSIGEKLEFDAVGNGEEQIINTNIELLDGQVLLIKGIGFSYPLSSDTANYDTFFSEEKDFSIGNTLNTVRIVVPIEYDILDQSKEGNLRKIINNNKQKISSIERNLSFVDDYSALNYYAFGDSITDDEISGLGSLVCELIGAKKIANYARGNATMSDYSNGAGLNITEVSLEKQPNSAISTNTISNQIRRFLQNITPKGNKIEWTHPIDGKFSIDELYGLGLGNTEEIPDIVYISAGTNDTKQQSIRVNDDTNLVFSQSYSQLTRITIASALRWAIETIQCINPSVNIFVTSPLQSKRNWNNTSAGLNTQYTWEAREIIKKVCAFCSVNFIDSYSESGFSNMIAFSVNDGIHPTGEWKQNIGKYVSKKIVQTYINRQ